jgi:hypothetical protein
MDINPIKTEQDYRSTLQEIESLMAAEPGTPEGERLDVLTTLVEAYERKHFPFDLPDPVEAITRMAVRDWPHESFLISSSRKDNRKAKAQREPPARAEALLDICRGFVSKGESGEPALAGVSGVSASGASSGWPASSGTGR